MSEAEVAKLRPSELAAIFNAANKAEAAARDISARNWMAKGETLRRR
jgi:hypothetical protein